METIICKDRDEWLLRRLEGIGASEAAAVLGHSKFTSALSVYTEKIGILPPSEDNVTFKKGRHLEFAVVSWFADETKRNLFDPGRYAIQRNPDIPFAQCTVDRFQAYQTVEGVEPLPGIEQGEMGVLEAKSARYTVKDEWEAGIPIAYQIQVQHQLMITGYRWGSVAVLIGDDEFLWFDVLRNEEFIGYLKEKEEEFWLRVQTKLPPEADYTASSERALKALHPKDNGLTVDLPAEAEEWDKELADAKEDAKDAKKREDEYKNRFLQAIGDATFGKTPNGILYSLKTTDRAEYVVKATSYRVLRRMK